MQRFTVLSQQTTRGKKTMVPGAAKPPTAAMRRRRVEQVRSKKGTKENQYGLSPVDYSKPPPIAPELLPPPPKRGFQSMLAPVTIAMFFGFGIYLYFNSDDETYEYWRQVETGGILVQDDDDDDEEEDDE